jgi:hypothetical protein
MDEQRQRRSPRDADLPPLARRLEKRRSAALSPVRGAA